MERVDVLKAHPNSAQSGSTAFGRRSWISNGLLILLLILGFGIRLYDLTDPPLDFHPTRQLRGAIVARGLYYRMLPNADPERREMAIAFKDTVGRYEPPILESIVAVTYLLVGGEHLWVARIYSSLFWVIGGVFLFLLAKRMTSVEAALVALGYYLFLPFAVQASRSFQPDPWMVMWAILTVYSLYRWADTPNWKWALLSGLFGGMAILVKVVAAYLLAGGAIAVIWHSIGIKRAVKDPQVWVMGGLMVLPAMFYYLLLNLGATSSYAEGWVFSLAHLLLDPGFYVRWLSFLSKLVGLAVIFLSLIGVLVSSPRSRVLMLGLWIGYGIYGLTLPYQMYTHNYYHLQLIPIIALSLAPIVQLLVDESKLQPRPWQYCVILVAVVAMAYSLWVARSEMASKDYRREPGYWEQLGSLLPDDGKIVALTQDYGYRMLFYGWRRVSLWPSQAELNLSKLRDKGEEKAFETFFSNRTEGKDYFLVTSLNQLESQPNLQQWLQKHFPLMKQGDGFLLYDLKHPLASPSN
jgi:hypothetical protein